MSPDITPGDLERFRTAISARLGLSFEEAKLGFLGEVLQRRSCASRQEADAYVSRLELEPSPTEIASLARELTVSETYFFRNADQYRVLRETVLPACLADRVAERRLRILSLGCASGEEAYSLAMLLADRIVDPTWRVSIRGVDVNPAMIEKARRGRYSAWALRETPEAERRRWFRPEGRDYRLDDALRASVGFEERNLLDDDPAFWQRETCDLVFCRNVLMYFAPEQARIVIGRVARLLRPGGWLFLGHAENLRGLSTDFHLRHAHGTFYYERKPALAWPQSVSAAAAAHEAALPPVPAPADTWFDTIRCASERVTALAERPVDAGGSHAGPQSGPDATDGPAGDLGAVLDLLQQERFEEALTHLDALAPAAKSDRDVLLLRAALLTHGGRLACAEAACRRLLDVDELSAGAHYLLALCREGAGDRNAATHHDQLAACLDPGFAMPRLHLGLLARRAGAARAARRELEHALVLLQREEPSRLLLFGGGFGRGALIALCRAELSRSGGLA